MNEIEAGTTCKHLIQWPTREQILTGLVTCPYCAADSFEAYRIALDQHIERTLRERDEALELSSRMNTRNTRLQRFAIELCRSPEQAADLTTKSSALMNGDETMTNCKHPVYLRGGLPACALCDLAEALVVLKEAGKLLDHTPRRLSWPTRLPSPVGSGITRAICGASWID